MMNDCSGLGWFEIEMATPKSSSDVKVLLLDPLHESSLTAFELAHFQVSECFEELTEGQLANKISDYHCK